MGNQAINSLALISARKTVDSLDVLSMLFATHLYCALQALDLRYLEFTFRVSFDPTISESLKTHFADFLSEEEIATTACKVRDIVWRRLEHTGAFDLVPRFADAFSHTSSVILDALTSSSSLSSKNPIPAIAAWRKSSADGAVALTRETRDEFFKQTVSPTPGFLGKTKALYSFVRNDLGVKARRGDVFVGKQEKTIGSAVSLIYDSIKNGKMNRVLVDMVAN